MTAATEQPELAPIATLRERLLAMREALIDGLADTEHLDGGLLRLLGDVGSALRAIDDVAPEAAGAASEIGSFSPAPALATQH